jgi:hypothetical protein
MRLLITFIVGLLVLTSTVSAQRNVTPAIDRDPVLEKDAKHNLESHGRRSSR